MGTSYGPQPKRGTVHMISEGSNGAEVESDAPQLWIFASTIAAILIVVGWAYFG